MADQLPQDVEAEKAVLGLMLISKHCLSTGMSRLEQDYFHKPTHALIFGAIRTLFDKTKEISIMSVREQLRITKALEAVGGDMRLAELAEGTISDTEFEVYVDILQDKAVKRRTIKAASAIMEEGYKDTQDQNEFVKFATEKMWDATPRVSGDMRIISSGHIYEERRKVMLTRQTRSAVRFGWKNLDGKIVSGYNPGDISVMGGRPSMGKSAAKTGMIVNLLEAKHGVVSFAPEQGFATEQDRLESIMTDIPLTEIIESGNWQKGDWRVKKIQDANYRMDNEFNYHIIPSRGLTIADARSALYRISQESKIDVVFFDLFDRLMDVNVAENKAQKVSQKLGELSRIAEEFDCHIMNLVQISRKVENRADKRPRLSDLKDSGNYEESARLILLLYREKYYFPDSLNNEVEFIIAKQSNGPRDTTYMTFQEDTLRMTPTEDNIGNF